MTHWLIISFGLLWVVVAVIAYTLVAIHGKVSTLLALSNHPSPQEQSIKLYQEDHGVPKGELFPERVFQSRQGNELHLNSPGQTGTFLFFTSSSCSTCKAFYPIANRFIKSNPQYRYIFLINGSEDEIDEITALFDHRIDTVGSTPEHMLSLQTGYVPFAYYLDQEGKVVSKSLINFEEQLYLMVDMISRKAA